jgi:polyvinyl alcohol dehydrogenase (cytochrome)
VCVVVVAIGGCSSSPDNMTPGTTPGTVIGASGMTAPAPTGGSSSPTGGMAAPVAGTAAPSGGTGGAASPVGGAGGMAAATGGMGGLPTGGTGGPTPGGNPDWKMIGYDVGSTYFNSAETVLTKENAATLAEAWTANMGGNVYGAPLQVGDKIYASGPGSVRAYDAATGNMLWMASVTSTASLAFDDGKLYANNAGGSVVALDAANGNMLWMKQPHSQRADGSSSPVVAGDLVLVGGSNGGIELSTGQFQGYLAALNKMTGDVAWATLTVPSGAKGASIWSSPSADLEGGHAYASTGNNYGAPATDSSDSIIQFDLASGTINWKAQREENDTFSLGGLGPDYDFGANPVLYETMVDGVMTALVSAGAKSGSAHAVRRDNGELVWTRNLGPGTANGSQGIFVNSTWTGKYMLFACNKGGPATLYALDGATGNIVWERPLAGSVWGRMSVANGVGFVGTGTKLEVFDVDTGDVIKSFDSKGGTVAGTITIREGRVAFGEGLSWANGVRGSTLTVLSVAR